MSYTLVKCNDFVTCLIEEHVHLIHGPHHYIETEVTVTEPTLVNRLSDLKFLTDEEQTDQFAKISDGLGTLLIQGRLTREGHRSILNMIDTLGTLWFAQQVHIDGTPIDMKDPVPRA